MPEADPAPVMEETAVANGGAAADVAAPDKKDVTTKEVAAESKNDVVADQNDEEQDKGSENGTKGPSDGDVKMAEAEGAKKHDGDVVTAKQVDSKGVKMDADVKVDNNAETAEGEDVKMTEAEAGNTEVKDKGQKEDKDENTNADKQGELKEQEKGGSADLEENKGKETGAAEKQEEEEAKEKGSAEKKEEDAADKKVEENKEETPKNKKARSARDRSQGKDKKQDGSKSREAKSLLSTPNPYATDRPQRERKTVERLVEVIEKEPNKDFVVEKGRGTPLKDIPSVAHRISRKKPADLKFLHNILFGRKGKTLDFKGHILQFSGFVWHESDEKQRAKAKEKLDKCVKDMLLDICWLLAIPVPKANIRKEDIVSKLLDFIAEPHGVADSGLSDDQGSNSRKRKRGGGSTNKTPESTPNKSRKKFGDDTTSGKRQKKALKYDTDEDEDEDESMKSDSEENKDEAADEQEDDYDSGKEKASKKSSEVKESSGKKKTDTGSGNKTGPPRTISKSPLKKSSSKISKEEESPEDSTKVFSRKRKPTPKGEKETKEKKPSGKKVTKGKGGSAEADLPSKDELRKTITGILKKVDFNTATFSDILKKLDNHYKMDLTPKKESIKVMIQDELTKLSEEADEDEDGNEDAGKKQQQHQAKEVEA
ncbi:DEK domain-containing chromatin-associated protein 4-like [Phragmites australis]|uniref:DEK domain-containing chromatin-associated protein 4-like n=1 Tax=Phragmites australis TaxID=29695 RepID=UPI002D794E20|nr:DEK domain-containing chromatin-associated protein 4-like [Phragmites australis]XP_062211759.1 DEK domain-containing chromatin-associated protein 4-like [Phragmites australis]